MVLTKRRFPHAHVPIPISDTFRGPNCTQRHGDKVTDRKKKKKGREEEQEQERNSTVSDTRTEIQRHKDSRTNRHSEALAHMQRNMETYKQNRERKRVRVGREI